MTITDMSTYTDQNGKAVSSFCMHFYNDRNRAGRALDEQVSDMLMSEIRELWSTGAWRHYRNGLGTFEWLEHEFDYFLASCLLAPRQVADIVRNGSIPAWAELVNSANPGPGQRRVKTKRPIAEVAAQIRQGVPGGHGDADVWVRHAGHGFGDRNDQQIAKSPTKVRKAVKAGNISAVKRPLTVRINLHINRDETKSEDVQRAEMILRYLDGHPSIAALVTQGQ